MRASSRPRASRGLLALAAASLALALAGTGLQVSAALARGSPAATNRAVTDPAATRAVIGAISTDVSRIFSYSYPRLAATRRAASVVLAGRAAAQYRELFPFLRNAGAQRLTVRTRVVRVGVTWLSATDARLLVFLNQTAARGRDKPSSVPAQLAITARYLAGRWRIIGIGAR